MDDRKNLAFSRVRYRFSTDANRMPSCYTILHHYTRCCEPSEHAYELMLLSDERACLISSSFISLSAPVFATPPVTIAPMTSFPKPSAETSAFQ